MRSIAVIFCSAALSAGCTTAPLNIETGDHAITSGSPEAIGVLELLNDPATDIHLLDKDAGLNVRAARNLIHHRDGWDGLLGSYDDNLFGDIDEVDSVRWVGPSAIASLVDFAATEGFIPEGADILGTWDNVTFTVDVADAVLGFVNDSDQSTLDFEVGLDRRAADSIFAALPITSVEELAGLYFVGTTALEALIEVSRTLSGTDEEEVIVDAAEGACEMTTAAS
jgi:hypothetical protein